MSINRLKDYFRKESVRDAGPSAVTPPGFVAVPTAPLTDISVECQGQRSLYEMAYLLARTGYVIEK